MRQVHSFFLFTYFTDCYSLIAEFAEDYRKTYVPADELQKQVDEFMDAYDSRILEVFWES